MANIYNVHPEAKIGKNVSIGNFTNIYEDVEIGDNCEIYGNVTIFPGARIGDNVRIFPGAVVAGIPQDLKFKGEKTYAYVGNGTTLRECVTVNRGTASKGETRVGENCLIMAYSHVAHDCRIGNRVIISNAAQLAGEVVVDDAAVIGGGSLVHQFCHLGRNIMLQGGALVNKYIPPFVKAAREPISYVGLNTLIQSFAVGETTPEEAHKIGMELAGAVLGGKYEFVLTTHVDKDHLHNHLIFNAVSFVDYKKYHSNKQS